MGIPQTGRVHLAAPDVGDGTNGAFQGGQMYFPGGISLFSGNGAPGDNVNGDLPLVGDIYIRADGGVGSTIYRCTQAGPGSVWAAIL